MSNIELTIGGSIHEGWKRVDVRLTMEASVGCFQLNLADKWGSTVNPLIRQIKPADPCTVSIDGQVVITGYIDKVSLGYDAFSHSITVEGRDKASDLIDSSTTNEPGQWQNLKLEKIVEKICSPFGIPIKTDVDTGKKFETFNIDQGMTAFESIQRLCRMRQVLPISDGKGALTLTRSETAKFSGAQLIQGENILVGQADYDFSDRHDEYIYKGQRQGDDNSSIKTIAENKGVARDPLVPRYRPLLCVYDGQTDDKECKNRATWECSTRKAKSRRFTITVCGWKKDTGGSLWAINELVYVNSSWLAVSDTLLVSEVNFKMDESGELTTLTLTSPDAFKLSESEGAKGGKHAEDNPYLED